MQLKKQPYGFARAVAEREIMFTQTNIQIDSFTAAVRLRYLSLS